MSTMDTFSVHGTERGAGPREELTLATVVGPLTRDFLTWVACRPRTYAEAMEAWRSSCPRFTIWEDAISDGLIQVARSSGVKMGGASVTLTTHGCAVLAGA